MKKRYMHTIYEHKSYDETKRIHKIFAEMSKSHPNYKRIAYEIGCGDTDDDFYLKLNFTDAEYNEFMQEVEK